MLVKNHKKHFLSIVLLLGLTNSITFCYCMSSGWILKYIEAERRAEACLPMQPKMITHKVLI